MRFVDHTQLASELAKALKKPALYIAFGDVDDWDELRKAAPYLADEGHPQAEGDNVMQCIIEGSAVIICDSEAERDSLYAQTVGDDGPTELNPYHGPLHIYALTIGTDGQFLNENT